MLDEVHEVILHLKRCCKEENPDTSMEENVQCVLKALHLEEHLDKAVTLLEEMVLLVESAEWRVAASSAKPEAFVGPPQAEDTIPR
jgi:hypothetical protein